MGNYLIVVQAPCRRLGPTEFATEGAFGEHLRMLRDRMTDRFDKLVVAAPEFSEAHYESQQQSLAHISTSEGIEFVSTHGLEDGRLAFWLGWASMMRTLSAQVEHADLVHSGLSDDLWRPMMLMVNALAKLKGRPLIFVVDIDFRDDTRMYYETGLSTSRQYWLNRLVYDPLKLVQVHLAPRVADLVLLKSPRMVQDIGKGASHVKSFFDTVHSPGHVIDEDALSARQERVRDPSRPLHLAFFGRFVPYKGLDRTLEVVAACLANGTEVHLDLIGQGPELERLQAMSSALGLDDRVVFHGAVPYGPELFKALDRADIAIATPLVEDTPRAAFDAFARGLPIVAFGIHYYRDLAEASGAVLVGDWAQPQAVARVIAEVNRDREALASMMQSGVRFAVDNTQDQWLERRMRWTHALVS